MANETPWLTRKQAVAYLNDNGCPVALSTLANMASNNNAAGGPPFYRVGWNRIRYNKADLDQWREKRMVRVE